MIVVSDVRFCEPVDNRRGRGPEAGVRLGLALFEEFVVGLGGRLCVQEVEVRVVVVRAYCLFDETFNRFLLSQLVRWPLLLDEASMNRPGWWIPLLRVMNGRRGSWLA